MMKRFAFAALALLLPTLAWAQSATTTTSTAIPAIDSVGDALNVVQLLAQAFKSGSWALFAGLLLTLVIAVARYLKVLDVIKIPDSWDKWVAMGLSAATSVSVGLLTGQDWFTIAQTAVTVAVAAIGGWEMVLRPMRDKLLKKAKVGSEK